MEKGVTRLQLTQCPCSWNGGFLDPQLRRRQASFDVDSLRQSLPSHAAATLTLRASQQVARFHRVRLARCRVAEATWIAHAQNAARIRRSTHDCCCELR